MWIQSFCSFCLRLSFNLFQICLVSMDYALLISHMGILHWTLMISLCFISNFLENIFCHLNSFIFTYWHESNTTFIPKVVTISRGKAESSCWYRRVNRNAIILIPSVLSYLTPRSNNFSLTTSIDVMHSKTAGQTTTDSYSTSLSTLLEW